MAPIKIVPQNGWFSFDFVAHPVLWSPLTQNQTFFLLIALISVRESEQAITEQLVTPDERERDHTFFCLI